MGVDYRVVAMFGVYFQTLNDIEEYITYVYPDAEVDYEGVNGVPQLEDITIESINSYSGEDFILGYPMTLGETVDAYKDKWIKAFPDNADDPIPHLLVGFC